jgi:hypothetical protein
MNEGRIAIIIAEGGSEKAFLTSLLKANYNFLPLTGKNPICFRNNNDESQIWLFPVPALGKTHAGGMSTLIKTDPYIKADSVLESHTYVLPQHSHIHYLVLTDTDGMPEQGIRDRETDIRTAFNGIIGISHETFEVHFPNKEIEVWLMAGLTSDFPDFARNGWDRLQLERERLEEIEHPKEFFDSILDSRLQGNRIAIGDRVGNYFDVEQARQLSTSFARFIDSLEDKGLLSN